jgi:serine/threonine protein kinase
MGKTSWAGLYGQDLMFQANQRVGEYVLDSLVAQTPYAEEWRAHHHAWSDQLALVKIPTDAQYVSNLQQEGVRLHRLVHPNILCPLGFDPKSQPPYLITEFIPGETLRHWIAGKKLSVDKSVNILRQVLEALRFGHERQIVHGDVRPENILLETSAAAGDFAASGSVKLTDFGVGQAATATVTRDAAAKAQPQRGSLAYVAPEQRDGAPPDVKSDIYSVGVVLFEMLTGEPPSGAELPSELNSDVPASLDDTFKKAYARRDRRFESAKAFLDALAPGGAPPPVSQAASPVETELKFREADIPVAPAGETAEPEPETGGELSLKSDDDYSPPAFASEDEPAAEVAEPLADEPAPATDEQLEEQQEAGADTAVTPEEQTGGEPVIPQIPRVTSRADRDALFDEISKKQVRSVEEFRNALKGYFEIRDMDQGESANIRLRLIRWADALAGGSAEVENGISLINAAARPLYIVKLMIRSTRGEEPERSQTLEHLIAPQAGSILRSADYRLIAHFSSGALNEKLLETIDSSPLRAAVINLTRDSRREFFGRIQREDLLIYRANVITAAYRFDKKKYRAFLVGNGLSIVSAGEPFTKIRQEPTKRAATLLNGEQIHQGMKELRRALDDSQWEAKANGILGAWRGKLAAAYVVEAKAQFKTFGWLESLEYSAKAGQLVPGQEDAIQHALLVRKRIGNLQLLPGTFVAVVLIGLAVLVGLLFPDQINQATTMKAKLIQIVQNPLLAAGVAAWIATLWSASVLKSRLARTDFAFYQAAVFPLLVALAIAFVNYKSPVRASVCGALLIAVIVADVMVFKKFRRYLIRPIDEGSFPGDGLTVLNRIESMLNEDWERIKPHYMELGPLYSYTSVHAAEGAMGELMQEPEAAAGSSDDTAGGTVTGSWHAAPAQSSSEPIETGNPEIDRLAAQMNARISANLRVLAPAARVLMTLFGEYTKAVNNHQIGMAQSNATKIEQKGKDLAAKLADFDRLCRSPLTLNAGDAADLAKEAGERLAARSEDPDVQLLKSLADRAKDFRNDQVGAASDIAAIASEVDAAVERLKKG